jgi:maleylpyruvate isomerase
MGARPGDAWLASRAVRPEPEVFDGVRASHRRLSITLDSVDDDTARAPSLLPGWTVGHVLTHIARNAESQERALLGALRGEVVARYPGGSAQRDADIENGARRPVGALVADVRATSARLESTWDELTDEAWEGHATFEGPERVDALPFARWREVEVHHVDLGLGYTSESWPAGYVRRDLAAKTMAWRARMPMGLTELPAAAQALSPASRLAWLLGRLDVDGLPAVREGW